MNRVLTLDKISKAFTGQAVLKDFSFSVGSGERICLMGPSGSGKTTLFRIIMGLETADSGQVQGLENLKPAPVFQEDRLVESLSPVQNIRIVTEKSRQEISAELARLLPESLHKAPCASLSGGEKRRVSIVRAMMARDFDLALLDEPFNGLDSGIRGVTASYILERLGKRALCVITHDRQEAGLLKCHRIVEM